MSVRERLDGVSIDTKANVYFDGRCVSHTIRLADGSRKSVGVILPAKLTFDTAAPEKELIAGAAAEARGSAAANTPARASTCRARAASTSRRSSRCTGEHLGAEPRSASQIEALEPVHYICHFG